MSDTNLGFRQQISLFRELAKSGIVSLVLISVLGGYLAGQLPEKPLDGLRLTMTLLGLLLLSSGSSALNQVQEKKIDAEMPRTAKRPLPSGLITFEQAVFFVVICLFLGTVVLFALSPLLAALGWVAVISYNGLYTLWWKKHWALAAIPGAIPGALPILMGYEAAHGNLSAPGGWYLFALLFFWQMPHFWVLAIKYQDDYAAGGIPTLPVTHGTPITVRQISVWSLAYIGIALAAPLFLHVGWIYEITSILMSIEVLRQLWKFSRAPESKSWLHFFLWVNFSLIAYIAAVVIDLWIQPLFPAWVAGV